ncbi:recombinase family protein [Bremerella cremea]|uniref:recombinase family protein n=1 Tax=Bremerella cremea TaxID=1031537 RepID=UPI0031ED707C
MNQRVKPPCKPKTIKCAIYSRKSTEEGLDQDFNSLDAQREAGEAYIKSQLHEGWVCLPDQYDDGGFTGANMERPALRRLLADIESGKVNCVVVYKVDRLSRSLLDFSRIMEVFDKHQVSFVSVTQAFNTASSMGRLVLNVLLSFAQFEREMISERTRDKMAAARRKGKWSGGTPILGYNVENTKLVINEAEARRVQEIFGMYLERKSLLAVAGELHIRGWRNKLWKTRRGTERGGRRFDKGSLYALLTSVIYIGKVRYKNEIHDGEQDGIIDPETFAKVQKLLQKNGQSGGRAVRNKHNALLRGILRCGSCNCGMSHSYSQKKGSRLYRYYVCQRAQKRGWKHCPAPSIPAGEIERFIVDEIKAIGRDPQVIEATLKEARIQAENQSQRLTVERNDLRGELREAHAELSRVAATVGPGDARLANAHDRIGDAERRLTEVENQLAMHACDLIDEAEVTSALADFDAVWQCLEPHEQIRIVELLIERIEYDGEAGDVSITFRPSGIRTLASELATR